MISNQHRRPSARTGWLGLAAAGVLFAGIGLASAGDAIRISLHGQGFSASANAASVELVKIRIGGPEGFRDRSPAAGRDVTWRLPSGAPDGVYRYDVYGARADETASTQAAADGQGAAAAGFRESGRFEVRNGVVQRPTGGDEEAALGPLQRALAAVLDFVVADASAQDLKASSIVPRVEFEDTNLEGGTDTPWEVIAGENSADCLSSPVGSRFDVEDDIQNNDVIRLCGAGGSGSTVSNTRSLVVDSAGDVVLGDGALFLDRSAADLGVGTTTPAGDLHVAGGGTVGNLVVSGTTPVFSPGGLPGSNSGEWDLNVGGGGLFFSDSQAQNNGAVKFLNGTPADTLVTNDQGFVGLGTDSPVRKLNVVQDGSPNSIPLRLDNPSGNLRFSMASQGKVWTFDNSGGNFRIVRAQNDGAEFVVDEDGNLRIQGTLTEGSSRSTKNGIEPVDTEAVLKRIEALPIARWNYEDQQGRHMGPMAEDFHAQFGLGQDEKHLAPRDLAAVAVAAAKGLKDRVDAQRDTIAGQRERLAEQERQLESLRAKVEQIDALKDQVAAIKAALPDRVAVAE